MPLTSTIMLVLLVCLAGWYDLRYRKIPNWLNVIGFVFAIAASGMHGSAALKNSGFGILIALAVYLPFYLLRGMGAGDVKLMAAIGALCGPGNWLVIFLITAILGGIASTVLVVYKRAGRETLRNLGFIIQELLHGRPPAWRSPELDIRNERALRLPHGVVIAAGSLGFAAFVRP